MASELAPGFLVAAASLLEQNFRRTVVLLVDHRPEGSLGFVINRPANVTLSGMMEALSLRSTAPEVAEAPVLVGGPVAPDTGWIVFDHAPAAVSGDEIVQVSERLAVSASRELLQTIAQDKGARHLLLVLGY